jgi:hypothetical protein
MLGSAVFTGGELTAAVACELAVVAPWVLVAVTCTTIVEPTSEEASVYVEAVAPEIAVQFAPFESQSSHW